MSSSPPTPIQYSTPWVVVFSPRSPAAARHLLVVPKVHIDDCDALVQGVRERINEPHTPGERDPDDSEEHDDREWRDDRQSTMRVEDEKELTPLQLLDHMLDVGRLVLANPQLLTDSEAGRAVPRRRRARRFLSLLCCQRARHATSSPLPRSCLTSPDGSATTNGVHAHGMNGASSIRRRQASSPVVPLSSSLTPDSGGRPGENAETEGAMAVGGADSQRFCFHAPPHHSIAHLHLHCFQLPFDAVWDELSFKRNSHWTREADAVREAIVKRDASAQQ